MNLVVHVCCAPCFLATRDAFAELGDVFGYFYNPNIHPLLEFRKRLKAAAVLAEREGLACEIDDTYGLHRFLELVPPGGAGRCDICYRERLGRTARLAAERAADAFTTTMLCSSHQDHDAIRRAGEAAAGETGVAFIYRDLRDRLDAGLAAAKKISLYRQHYCGCIFSEYDRYKDTNVDVHRETGDR